MTLDDIKPGDEVAVVYRLARRLHAPRRAVIDRVTPTQVLINGTRFRRDSGRAVGDRTLSIEPWTEKHDEAVARAADDTQRSRILYAMEDRAATRKLTLDQLRRIEAILQEGA